MFARSYQLDQLRNSQCDSTIKIIFGIRRSGKSTLINQYQSWLKQDGILCHQIKTIDFEHDLAFASLTIPAMVSKIKKELVKEKTNFLFLDELECLPNYQQLVRRLTNIPNIDLYVTGSDHQICKLAEQFSCRLIAVRPFRFHEFIDFHHQAADFTALYHYLNRGGFPFAQSIRDDSSVRNYSEDVLNTIILKSLMQHPGLVNPNLLKHLITFLAHHSGVPINVSQAVTALQERNIQVSNKTLASYLAFVQEGFLFTACPELNLATERVKKTNVQYYPVDPILRCLLTNHQGALSAANLTMLVFNELTARGFHVYSGQKGRHPVTFIATRDSKKYFFQFNFSFLNQAAYDKAVSGLHHLPASAHRTLIIAKPSDHDWGRDEDFTTVPLLNWLTNE